MSTDSFWIIGCGNMAGAMLARWLETGLGAATITIVDPAMPDFAGVTSLPAVPADAAPAGRVLLAVKPQMLDDVAVDVARLIGPETQLLSILAGVELATLAERFPSAREIVRIMPNLPVRLGKGVVALHSRGSKAADVTALMQPLGLVEWIENEDDFHLVSALSGSGPAFLYRFIDALGAAAHSLGMQTDRASRLALATVEGSAMLAAQSDAEPAKLADRVASKGGMTREGLNVLDTDRAIETLLKQTLEAAVRRSREMSAEAQRSR